MIDQVDLTNWKTRKVILAELGLEDNDNNSRAWRLAVEKQNELYHTHESETFIAHSNKGYKIAENEEEIRKSVRDYFKRGIDQITKSRKILKAIGENANMKIIFKNNKMKIVGAEL